MDWRIKGIIQKILSNIPLGIAINTYLQKKVGGLKNFSSIVDIKVVNDWSVFMQHTNELDISIKGKSLLEIGTGWFPVFPICYYLAGASHCFTYDINRHIDTNLTKKLIEILNNYCQSISYSCNLGIGEIQSRYNLIKNISNVDRIFECSNIYYNAPCDATCTKIADQSIDIVFTNSVLEHVPYSIIIKMMQETYRVLKKGGITMHSVNCGDHYAYFDKNISFNNYLKYTNKQWKKWNNELLYQNRLRPLDFVNIVEKQGFEVVLIKQKPRKSLMDIFDIDNISDEFKQYSKEQLCTTSVDFVAIKR